MKTWLITGCSSGLGRSIARKVLEQGDQVVVTARKPESLLEFTRNYPNTALVTALDVTDQTSIEQAVTAAQEHFGTIDVLVNNAGYGYRAAVEEGDPKDTERLFQTNFWGPIALMKAVLPGMRVRKSDAIINVSSIAALRTSPGSGYYAASKCALEGLSDGLRIEAAPLGIKVMVVEPGAFRTDFAGRSLTQSSVVIPDYEETAGARRIGKDLSHGTQPGDPDEGALCILKAIEADNPPFRLLLGSDAVQFAEKVMADQQKEYADWRDFSRQSDFNENNEKEIPQQNR